MRDHDPNHAAFEPDDDGDAPQYESVRDVDADERDLSRPSLRYLDIHDRPTLIPL